MIFKCFIQNFGWMSEQISMLRGRKWLQNLKGMFFVCINNQQATNFSRVRSREANSSLVSPLAGF